MQKGEREKEREGVKVLQREGDSRGFAMHRKDRELQQQNKPADADKTGPYFNLTLSVWNGIYRDWLMWMLQVA